MINGSTFENFKEEDQVQLLKDLSENIGNRFTFDNVVFTLSENYWIISPEIAALSEAISDGEEVDQCEFCNNYAVIVGSCDDPEFKWCASCKEEEEANA